jgi:hypothetical protein
MLLIRCSSTIIPVEFLEITECQNNLKIILWKNCLRRVYLTEGIASEKLTGNDHFAILDHAFRTRGALWKIRLQKIGEVRAVGYFREICVYVKI